MSFQQGLSGLNASAKNLEVIGNNVANAATFGAKSSRAEFSSVYASALNGAGGSSIGIGVTLATVAQQFSQGSLTTTDNAMDLAINGGGFFKVQDGNNQTLFTRNGQFKMDRDGYIVNNQQQKLMGYGADAQGVIIPGQAVAIQLPTSGIDPRATDEIRIELNLDARKPVTAPAAGGIDFADPTTYNNATSGSVYDAKGQEIALTYYFQKTATDSWNVFVTANGAPINTAAPVPPALTGVPQPSATLAFPTNGGNPTAPLAPVSIDIPSTSPTGLGTTVPITGVLLDLTRATQYGSSFGVTDLNQTGYAAGQLVGVAFEENGVLTARYSNGQTKAAGQLELASFRNPQGLQPLGGNAWASTFASGDAVLGAPAEGNFGAIQSGTLEESNVDLTGELVSMITAQRVYQANAQTIKTQDSVLQTLVNLR